VHTLRRLLDRSRRRIRGWSQERDRTYHDELFAAQSYDPFTFAYPGYITIRRFADLAEPYVRDARLVLDLGCGPGEITCELARRQPDVRFRGIDHSARAIEKANEHRQRLGLANVEFACADVERFEPDTRCDLVAMFDAFHHLLDPEGFVQRLGRATDRFLLVEPHGGTLGTWRRDLDCDWLVADLDRIRRRFSYLVGDADAATEAGGGSWDPGHGEATEHRYPIEDFQRFFAGYGLAVRGTVAAIEAYPSSPYNRGALKERFGRLAYELMSELDALLQERRLDLHAKHWVIYAERGAASASIASPAPLLAARDAGAGERVQGPYDVEYLSYEGPHAGGPADIVSAEVTVRNRSWRTWTSHDTAAPFLLSYHWLDRHGRVIVRGGVRSPFPRPVAPGEHCRAAMRVILPQAPGRYTLAIDVVHETAAWFSEEGSPCLKVPFNVSARRGLSRWLSR